MGIWIGYRCGPFSLNTWDAPWALYSLDPITTYYVCFGFSLIMSSFIFAPCKLYQYRLRCSLIKKKWMSRAEKFLFSGHFFFYVEPSIAICQNIMQNVYHFIENVPSKVHLPLRWLSVRFLLWCTWSMCSSCQFCQCLYFSSYSLGWKLWSWIHKTLLLFIQRTEKSPHTPLFHQIPFTDIWWEVFQDTLMHRTL